MIKKIVMATLLVLSAHAIAQAPIAPPAPAPEPPTATPQIAAKQIKARLSRVLIEGRTRYGYLAPTRGGTLTDSDVFIEVGGAYGTSKTPEPVVLKLSPPQKRSVTAVPGTGLALDGRTLPPTLSFTRTELAPDQATYHFIFEDYDYTYFPSNEALAHAG